MIAKPFKTFKKFVIDHWLGHFTFIFSIVVVLILLRLAIWLVPNPFDNLIFTSILIAVNSTILIWQIVGVIRAGDKHLKSENGTVLTMASYLVIVASCYLVALQTADWLSGDEPIKITQESLRTRPLPKTNSDHTKLYLEGAIDFEMNQSVRVVLNENPMVDTIILNSEGGAVYAARAIANWIIENQLNTHIDGICNSACTLIFMAGTNRTIDANGQIGFHQYSDSQVNPLNTNQVELEQEKDRAFFKSRGVTQKFLTTLFQAKHDEIWTPDIEILRKEGVITPN